MPSVHARSKLGQRACMPCPIRRATVREVLRERDRPSSSQTTSYDRLISVAAAEVRCSLALSRSATIFDCLQRRSPSGADDVLTSLQESAAQLSSAASRVPPEMSGAFLELVCVSGNLFCRVRGGGRTVPSAVLPPCLAKRLGPRPMRTRMVLCLQSSCLPQRCWPSLSSKRHICSGRAIPAAAGAHRSETVTALATSNAHPRDRQLPSQRRALRRTRKGRALHRSRAEGSPAIARAADLPRRRPAVRNIEVTIEPANAGTSRGTVVLARTTIPMATRPEPTTTAPARPP